MNRNHLTCVLFVFCCLLTPSLSAAEPNVIEQRVKQIEAMSKVDRDRLDRNIDAFQKMSDAQRAQFRTLHEELAADRLHAGGLSGLLQTYALWVQTLTPAERDELQQVTDPAQKLAVVRKIKEAHDHPKPSHETHAEEPVHNPNPKFPLKGTLDAKDLASVIKVIVESLPSDQKREEFLQPQLDAYLPIISASAQLAPTYREWPDEVLMPKMIGAIRNKEIVASISKASSKREAVIRLMLTGIMKQAMESVRMPTEEERIQTYEALSPAEKQHLISHPREEMERMIVRKYFDSKGDESHKRIPVYQRQVLEMFERLDVPPPPRMLLRKRAPQANK